MESRLDRLTSELGLDRERAWMWCLAQTIAWSVREGGQAEAGHADVARWILSS